MLLLNHHPPNKINAGVQFDQDVLDFLLALQTEFDRSRSYLINEIVRQYADVYRSRAKRPVVSQSIDW